MARISDEDIDRVRSATDLVQLASERMELKQRGRLYWGCCPFHGEKTPSFKIDPDTQLWHCFGCGKGGNVFGFVMEADHMEFPDAVRWLADRAHIELHEEGGRQLPRGYKERLRAIMQESAEFYSFALRRSRSDQASAARAYLSGRGMGSAVCKRWGLGFAPGRGALVRHLTKKGFERQELIDSNMALVRQKGQHAGQLSDRFYDRVMFPIHDAQGATIAFGGRVIGPTPPNTGKYINTADTPIFNKRRNMFAFDRAKASITSTGTAVVVEGYTDVIALHEAGITNVVATLGTSLTPEHLRLLRTARPKRIVYLFDGDAAGQKAADRAASFVDLSATAEAGRDYVQLLVAVIPGNQDPAEYVADQGARAMHEVIDGASSLLRFAIDRRLAPWDLSVPGQRQRALNDVARLLAPIKGTLESDDYANYVADRLGARFETVQRAFLAAKPLPKNEPRPLPERDARRSREQQPRLEDTPKTPEPALPARPSSETDRLERELLALTVSHPQLAPRLHDAFERTPWSTPAVAYLASLALDLPPEAPTAARVASLEKEVPGVGPYLAAAQLDPEALGGLDASIRRILNRLKVLDLEKQVRSGMEQIKEAEINGKVVDNTLFANVAKLQQELNNLRNASSS